MSDNRVTPDKATEDTLAGQPPNRQQEQPKDTKVVAAPLRHCLADILANPKYKEYFSWINIALPVLGVFIASAMIAMGARYYDMCPAQYFLPIYLIVGGAFGMLGSVVFRISEDCQISLGLPAVVLLAFLFAWLITGSVFIYAIHDDMKHQEPTTVAPTRNASAAATTGDKYCNETLYTFAFWITTSTYIVMALLCLIPAVYLCYDTFTHYSEKKEKDRAEKENDKGSEEGKDKGSEKENDKGSEEGKDKGSEEGKDKGSEEGKDKGSKKERSKINQKSTK